MTRVVLSASDLGVIYQLIGVLNEYFDPAKTSIDFEIEVGDSNGDRVGQISFGEEGVSEYTFVPHGG